MKAVYWWTTRSLKNLSPFNPDAVALTRLDPPFYHGEYRRVRIGTQRYAQLFWLQWHAVSYVRKELTQLTSAPFSFPRTEVHTDTLAEWREPLPLPKRGEYLNEYWLRRDILRTNVLIPAETAQAFHPSIWTGEGLAVQAAQSAHHGDLLAEVISQCFFQQKALDILIRVYYALCEKNKASYSARFQYALQREATR